MVSDPAIRVSPPAPGQWTRITSTNGGMHCPVAEQVSPAAQDPQLPPQPLFPQTLPVQFGVQGRTHCPEEQMRPPEQDPQLPPQPLLPQTFPVQFGVQQAWVLQALDCLLPQSSRLLWVPPPQLALQLLQLPHLQSTQMCRQRHSQTYPPSGRLWPQMESAQ